MCRLYLDSGNRWFFVTALSLAALGCGSKGAEPAAGTSGSGGAAVSNMMESPSSAAMQAAVAGTAPAAPSSTIQKSSAAAGSGGVTAAAPAAGSSASAGQVAAAMSGAGSSGGSAGASAPQAMLSVDGSIYTFKQGRRSLVIDAQHGARITRFGLDDKNLLTGPDIDMLNFGSTFWPSPQERWNWPPVPEIDSDPYEVKQEADAVSFTSKPGMRAKVTVAKRIRALAAEDDVEITYSLTNNDSSAVSWAAWEITRVAASGLSFFPTGSRKVGTQLAVVDQGGVTWLKHDPAKIMGEGQKFTADGAEGWLAHVAGTTLLVKQFMDVPADAQAPAPEAEIALYAAKGYVEIEPQGPYTMLKPGESLTWTVRWRVAELPSQVPAEVGSAALVDFVRQLISK